MNRLCKRWIVPTAVLAMGIGWTAVGDDAPEQTPQQVIVLLNGRVIKGDIEDRPGGYLVQSTIGQTVIPFTQVRLTAKDLPDAYHKLQESMTTPTASGHVSLGQWCFDNRLYTSALEQMKSALLLEPERKDARTLLKQIERATTGAALEASIPSAPPRTRDGFQQAETKSIDGLSPSLTQDYVRRVQPLLMNKCGNARCHGVSGTSDFALSPVRMGMSGFRTITDQNLSAVMRQIDRQQPRLSPLLIVSQGTHGGNRPLWIGPRADEQQAELRAWVTRAALEQSQIATTTGMDDPTPQSTDKAQSDKKRDPFLRQVLAEERPDKFNPAIFNRLMHGRE